MARRHKRLWSDRTRTSQAEPCRHAAQHVPDDPLAVERVLVEERKRAHHERVRERRRVRVQGRRPGRHAVGVRAGRRGRRAGAPDGEAEEEEELREGRVEERERHV